MNGIMLNFIIFFIVFEAINGVNYRARERKGGPKSVGYFPPDAYYPHYPPPHFYYPPYYHGRYFYHPYYYGRFYYPPLYYPPYYGRYFYYPPYYYSRYFNTRGRSRGYGYCMAEDMNIY
ncbi:ATP-dependent zinc metalloprotease FtsH [Dirofilaria immitis]